MLYYPKWLKPDLLHVGPIRVRWYGVMYLVGFFIGRFIARHLAKVRYLKLSVDLVDDFLIALFIGMILGARIIYMLVYYEPGPDSPFRWYTPFAVWEGGLSFHGAVIGMVVAGLWFARKHHVPLMNLTDSLALFGSQGIIFGRIGNFINAELYGNVTKSFMGMQFPVRDFQERLLGWTEPRHPSQLYESVGEGLIPFILIWILKPRIRYQGEIGGIWVCLYAFARFLIEFFREKDEQMSYYFGWMTMGQVLCALMFVCGIGVILWSRARGIPVSPETKIPEPEAPAQPE